MATVKSKMSEKEDSREIETDDVSFETLVSRLSIEITVIYP